MVSCFSRSFRKHPLIVHDVKRIIGLHVVFIDHMSAHLILAKKQLWGRVFVTTRAVPRESAPGHGAVDPACLGVLVVDVSVEVCFGPEAVAAAFERAWVRSVVVSTVVANILLVEVFSGNKIDTYLSLCT
jgi:hypothetical protein